MLDDKHVSIIVCELGVSWDEESLARAGDLVDAYGALVPARLEDVPHFAKELSSAVLASSDFRSMVTAKVEAYLRYLVNSERST